MRSDEFGRRLADLSVIGTAKCKVVAQDKSEVVVAIPGNDVVLVVETVDCTNDRPFSPATAIGPAN